MPSGLLLKFNASHHALVTLLVLEATLVKHLRRCYLWKCNGKVPKLFFYAVPWIWSILAQISAIEGAAHGLQPCNSNERTHIRAGGNREIDVPSSFSISNPPECLEEIIVPQRPAWVRPGSSLISEPCFRIGCHAHRTSATVLVLWPILVILAHFGPDLSTHHDCGRAATWWQFNHWLKVF